LRDRDLCRIDLVSNNTKAKPRTSLPRDKVELENQTRNSIDQLFAGMLAFAGAAVAWRNVIVAMEGKLTGRFSKAIEHATHESESVRIGGIHALERIARDSEEDRTSIAEILCSFIRGKTTISDEDYEKACSTSGRTSRRPLPS
jgi:hypothetical protein